MAHAALRLAKNLKRVRLLRCGDFGRPLLSGPDNDHAETGRFVALVIYWPRDSGSENKQINIFFYVISRKLSGPHAMF